MTDLTRFSTLSMKAFLLSVFLLSLQPIVWAGDTTGTWIGTMEHQGTGANKTVWFVKMDLTIEGTKCHGTISYDFMQRNSPLTLQVKFQGSVLENTLVINYYSKDVKKIGTNARSILLQYRYNLLLVKNKFNDNIYGEYVGLSKGLIADQTKGYLFLEPQKGDTTALTQKIDQRIDSLIASRDKPMPPPDIVLNNLPSTTNETSLPKKTEELKTDIKASTTKLPEINSAITTTTTTPATDTVVTAKTQSVNEKKDTVIVSTTIAGITKKESPFVTTTQPTTQKKDTQPTITNTVINKEKELPITNTNNSSLSKTTNQSIITKDTLVQSVTTSLNPIKSDSSLPEKDHELSSALNNFSFADQNKKAKQDTGSRKTALPEVQIKLQSRENIITDRLMVDSGQVVIEFYDNGTIDGDIITVIHNKSIALSNAMLSDKPLRFTIEINPENPYHEIVMYAENQGSIPPNTALMIITYGNERKQVFLSADFKKSAVVVLELNKK
jgi:hypothetical protein